MAEIQKSRLLNIRIVLTNDAFVENMSGEIKTILNKIPEKIEDGIVSGTLMDSNGNKVGSFNLSL